MGASAAFVGDGSVQDGQVHPDIYSFFLSAGKVIAVKHAKVGKGAGASGPLCCSSRVSHAPASV